MVMVGNGVQKFLGFRKFYFYEVLIMLLGFCFLTLFSTTFCVFVPNKDFRATFRKFFK